MASKSGGAGGGRNSSAADSNDIISLASRANPRQAGNLNSNALRRFRASDLARAADIARFQGNTNAASTIQGFLNRGEFR